MSKSAKPKQEKEQRFKPVIPTAPTPTTQEQISKSVAENVRRLWQ